MVGSVIRTDYSAVKKRYFAALNLNVGGSFTVSPPLQSGSGLLDPAPPEDPNEEVFFGFDSPKRGGSLLSSPSVPSRGSSRPILIPTSPINSALNRNSSQESPVNLQGEISPSAISCPIPVPIHSRANYDYDSDSDDFIPPHLLVGDGSFSVRERRKKMRSITKI